MARMIGDLLDFTGAGLGAAMPLCPVAADLASVCRDVCSEFRAAHPTRSIRFEFSGDLVGTWDPARLRQVVSNLLGNAVQHGAGTGPGIGSVDLAVHAQDEGIVLSVRNGGAPIPPEALPTIFDPLTRVSPERNRQRRPGSIGLGLYIAREIVTAHEGSIAVQSSAAEGTTFSVRLPRHVATSAAQASGHPSAGLAPAQESVSPAIFVKAK
ncbi:MAG TPA: HAMP domain-containing sensor histidine kinase [Verrucomicrobiales bacterium]|nr:HAMP domain-containing sensor histidine kinase [Verrucomicrobiales bacterium]